MSWLSFMIDDGSLLMHGVLVFLVLREFVPLRFRNRILHAAEILCLTMVGNVIVYAEEITGTVGSLLGLLPILILFHKGEWYKKLTAALIVYPAMMALAFLFQDIGQWIWKYLFNKEMSDTGQTLLYLLMRCLKVPAWYLIYRSVKAWVPGAIRMLTRRMWLVLAVIALTSFVGIIIIIYKCTYEDSYLAWPACVATLITSMGCCYLCTYMEKIVRAEMELASMQYQKFYYQEIENNQQTVRRMRHDMKNHLSVIETLLRDGKYEKAGDHFHCDQPPDS